MKYFNPIVLLLLALPLSGISQNVTDKEITYEYRRLPLTPLDRSLKNYTSKIEVLYEAENQAKLSDRVKMQQEADAKFILDMEQYERDLKNVEPKYLRDIEQFEREKKELQAQYDKQLEEYNKQSLAEKMANKTLLNEGKPVLIVPPTPYRQTPSKPYKETIPEPRLRLSPDKDILASNLRLDGFTRNDQNAVKITAILHGFDMTEKPVPSTSHSTANGQVVSHDVTRYSVSYRYPISVKVEVPGKGIVLNEVVSVTNEMKTTTNSNSINYGNGGSALEEKLLSDNMKIVSEYINERFGYSPVSRSTIFYSVQPKKFTYDEFTQASDAAQMAYRKLAEEPAESAEKLRSAITQWEKALAESNPKDSKARINEDVTIAAMLNLAEAALFTDDFNKSETHLFKLESLDLSRKQKKKMEELNLLLKDQKKRYLANK